MKNNYKKLNFTYKKPPLIIAEISGNHNGDKSRFLRLIKEACKSNADLIKIQTYEPDDITLPKKIIFLKLIKVFEGKIIIIYTKKPALHMNGIKMHLK